jgi:hypothetical protein
MLRALQKAILYNTFMSAEMRASPGNLTEGNGEFN